VISPTDLSDEDLASRAQSGDEAAFNALMRRHKTWLYNFVRRYVGGSEDAYDILQDSFVAAWRNLASYDPARPFKTWIRQIALNKCRDNGRKMALRRLFSGAMPTSDVAASTERWANPGSQLETTRALQQLSAAISALPRGLKEPLLLTAIEGLSHQETSQMLGISPKAVETRIYRARNRLGSALDPAYLDAITDENRI
jgi:RNA polymerase sigma factor (sigma-70 family)